MKTATILLAACLLSAGAYAKGGGGHVSTSHSSSHTSGGHVNSQNHSVSGYVKKDGTHVAPSHATNPNGTTHDNYTHKGNVNPYTGATGTKP